MLSTQIEKTLGHISNPFICLLPSYTPSDEATDQATLYIFTTQSKNGRVILQSLSKSISEQEL